MKIEEVSNDEILSIETDEDEYFQYLRFSKNCWYVWMGESLEPCYDCEAHEKAYQEYLKEKND